MARKAKTKTKSNDPDGYHVEVADLNDRAGVYESQGRYAEAEPLYRRALTISEKALGPDHPDLATFMNYLAAISDARVVRYNLKILQEKNSTKAKSDIRTGYLQSFDNKVDFGMIFHKDGAVKIGTGG